MIYDVNSPLFRSFLSQKGGSSDKSWCMLCYCRLAHCWRAVLIHPPPPPNSCMILLTPWTECCASGLQWKAEEQKPKEHRPKANENKPVMTE
ncbi:unnamed protein product [Camellia sinensis]